MKKLSVILISTILVSSCVSKKKYLALEQEKGEVVSELTKTKVEKEDLEAKFNVIQERVEKYNTTIGSLKAENDVKFDANSSKQSTARTFPVSNFLLRLGEEDHHRRSEEYVNSMKKMGWINFEEFKITKDMEVNLTNNTTATERTRRRMGLLMGTFIFGSFLFHIVRKSI